VVCELDSVIGIQVGKLPLIQEGGVRNDFDCAKGDKKALKLGMIVPGQICRELA
jgi:hypothetical protein